MKKKLRTNFIVDGKFQGTWLVSVVISMLVGASLVAGFLHFIPDEAFRKIDNADAVRTFALQANAAYFCLAAAVVLMVVVSLTHRVAGAARVIHSAVEGFRRGDYTGRLTLRQNDYLQNLAAELRELGIELGQAKRERHRCHRQLVEAIDAGDLDRARSVINELFGSLDANPADVDEDAEAEVETASAHEPASRS